MHSRRSGVSRPSGKRLIVPDVLRGVAIVAMLIAHAIPMLPNVPWAAQFVMSNINDVASPLFALVMGISAQIVWNRPAGIGRTILQQWIKGLVLIALGVWMVTWGSWVAVVLQYLGLLLIVGVPLLLFGTRTLIIVTAAIAVLSQPLLQLVRGTVWIYTQPAPIVEIANWFALGHSYRLINLLPFFLLGALLLRRGFHRDALLWTMAVVAPLAWLARPIAERMGVGTVTSGDYLDTLHDIGLVFVAYVVVVLAATARRVTVAKFWGVIFVPLRTWGQLALSLYLLHVSFVAWWTHTQGGRPQQNEPIGWLMIAVLPLIVASLWWRLVGIGPVEWMLGQVSGRPRRWRAERSTDRGTIPIAGPGE